MNERFIAAISNLYGHWGVGTTLGEALTNARKAGARKRDKFRTWQFTSELPFAPPDREATEEEADCWVGQDGSINWVRCDSVRLS